MSTIPQPRDGSTVIAVAVDGVPLTWVGPMLGTSGVGEIAGDGTPTSHQLIKEARALWSDPIEVDHASWQHPFHTTDTTPEGVLVTLLHLGAGRAVILQAPATVLNDVFTDDDTPDSSTDNSTEPTASAEDANS